MLFFLLQLRVTRYHNALHAADVLQASQRLISEVELSQFPEFEQLAFIFAAIVFPFHVMF